MKKITLVGCCAQKLSTVALARDLYRSHLFQKSAKWAENQGDEWFILSAKYGIVKPCGHIAPYESSLAKMNPVERSLWNEAVAFEIKDMVRLWEVEKLHITVMAGKSYTGWIDLLDGRFEVFQPMVGLQIGQRLNWLNTELAGGSK